MFDWNLTAKTILSVDDWEKLFEEVGYTGDYSGLFERLKMKNIKILEMMLKIRMVEEQIASSYTDQKMRCPTHLSVGQEAVPATLSQFLTKDDFAVSTIKPCSLHSKGRQFT